MAKYIDLSVDETIDLQTILGSKPPQKPETIEEDKDNGSN